MTQAERDRLVTLKKAKRKLITQGAAGEELGLSIRQAQRLVEELKERGDRAVIHGLRGKPSNRRIGEEIMQEAVKILSRTVYARFKPTMAAEYLGEKHGIEVSKETVRKWMMAGKLWRGRKARVEAVHTWRPRRSRRGELVQWDSSEHDWQSPRTVLHSVHTPDQMQRRPHVLLIAARRCRFRRAAVPRSMPLSSAPNSSTLTSRPCEPASPDGIAGVPASNRLVQIANPSRSQYKILSRSRGWLANR